MPSVDLSRPLPPCIVSKKLLQQLERELLQFAADIDGEDFDRKRYSVRIKDDVATVEYHSIEEYRSEAFQSGTQSIQLSYWNSYKTRISLNFSTDPPHLMISPTSGVHVSFRSDTAAERAPGIADQLVRTVMTQEYRHFFRRRALQPTLRLGCVVPVLFCLTASSGAFALSYRIRLLESATLVFGTLAVAVAAYVSICDRLPYCYFDSPSHNQLRESVRYWTRWFVGGFLTLAALKPAYDLFKLLLSA